MTSAAQRDCFPVYDGPAATAVAHAETQRGADPKQRGLSQPSHTDAKVWASLVDEDFAVLVQSPAKRELEEELAGRASDSDGGYSVRAASSCWAPSPVFFYFPGVIQRLQRRLHLLNTVLSWPERYVDKLLC